MKLEIFIKESMMVFIVYDVNDLKKNQILLLMDYVQTILKLQRESKKKTDFSVSLNMNKNSKNSIKKIKNFFNHNIDITKYYHLSDQD